MMSQRSPFPRLYAIADAMTLDARGMSVAPFARELREAGVRLVQYRDKVGAPQKVLRVAGEIAEAFAGINATLVLNDRADLAALLGWGVHVGQGDMSPADARFVLGSRSRFPSGMTTKKTKASWVGLSTHHEEQVIAADANDSDYIAIGPVFATSTKADAEPVVGLDGVRRARALTRKPLVAIGGITLENCSSVVDAGADSVAVISGLFVAGRSVREAAEDFLARLR
jgi:thiamine-phosphate pyrophosphorylase